MAEVEAMWRRHWWFRFVVAGTRRRHRRGKAGAARPIEWRCGYEHGWQHGAGARREAERGKRGGVGKWWENSTDISGRRDVQFELALRKPLARGLDGVRGVGALGVAAWNVFLGGGEGLGFGVRLVDSRRRRPLMRPQWHCLAPRDRCRRAALYYPSSGSREGQRPRRKGRAP